MSTATEVRIACLACGESAPWDDSPEATPCFQRDAITHVICESCAERMGILTEPPRQEDQQRTGHS